jgi:PDDEXK-like domain of unknown function (DUF3799)
LKIDKSGFYPNISAADYHADCCPEPSLSQSLAKILIARSPLHAWYAHPRLNPDWQPYEPTKFDLGNAAHKLMLGRGKDFEVLDFENWLTKAAKEAREAAHKAGKVAILREQFTRAQRMVVAGHEQLELMPPPADTLFGRKGNGEICIAWNEGNTWFRQLIDWMSSDGTIVGDYKTTDMPVAPHEISRKMQSDNWPIQAAMAERGLGVIDPEAVDKPGLSRRFFFVAQEVTAPYQLTVCELGEGHLERGRQQLEHAIGIWRACMKRNVWPGYPRQIIVPDVPGWADVQWEERDLELKEREKMIMEIV